MEPETFMGVRVPGPRIMPSYGMTHADWEEMVVRQGGTCGVCGKLPPSARLFVDHEHVRGWKHMPPEERKRYVRGLACYTCNRFILNYRVTPELLEAAASYLRRYEDGGRA